MVRPETLEWLHYLLRLDPRAPLLVLCTLRLEEMDDDHPLSPRGCAPCAAPDRLTELTLGPLNEDDTLPWRPGGQQDTGSATTWRRASMARQKATRSLWSSLRAPAGSSPSASPSARPKGCLRGCRRRSRIAWPNSPRQARNWPDWRRPLAASSLLPCWQRRVTRMKGSDDRGAARALDELWQRRVVREQGGEGYDFTHDKLRQVAYARMSRARQHLLHARVATVLQSVFAADPGPISAQVAAHLEQAGETLQALPHTVRAAEHARRIYANDEALAHYDRVLTLTAAQPDALTTPQHAAWRVEALSGLGQIALQLGQPLQAEKQFREALALGQEMGIAPRRLARIAYWLGRALFDQFRHQDMIVAGEQGLALLGEDRQSVEAALILHTMALGYDYTGNRASSHKLWQQAASVVQNLPYEAPLGDIYMYVFSMYLRNKDVEQASHWLHTLANIAPDEDDNLRGNIHQRNQELLARQGDITGAIDQLQMALAAASRAGNLNRRAFFSWWIGFLSLYLGDIEQTQVYSQQALRFDLTTNVGFFYPWGYWLVGLALLCAEAIGPPDDLHPPGNEQAAESHLAQAIAHGQNIDLPEAVLWSHQILGRVQLRQGDRAAALAHFEAAAEQCTPQVLGNWRARDMEPYSSVFMSILNGLEASADGETFRARCRHLPGREQFAGQEPGALSELALVQWFLAPAKPALPARLLIDERFDAGQSISAGCSVSAGCSISADSGELPTGWVWHDPFEDCRYRLHKGLEIHAANGRDLWHVNRSAPRCLVTLPGGHASLAIQTICGPARDDRPSMGGLLLWIDGANYVRLDLGAGGPNEVRLTGCLDNRDMIIGRGRLPVEGNKALPQRVTLRLEWRHAPKAIALDKNARAPLKGGYPARNPVKRTGEAPETGREPLPGGQINALCSIDGGQTWLTAGYVALPFAPSAQAKRTVSAGLYAIGRINRTIYHGAYPDGAAIRFSSFRCWTLAAPRGT